MNALLRWLFPTRPPPPERARDIREQVYAILISYEIESMDAVEIVGKIEALGEREPDELTGMTGVV